MINNSADEFRINPDSHKQWKWHFDLLRIDFINLTNKNETLYSTLKFSFFQNLEIFSQCTEILSQCTKISFLLLEVV